MRCELYLNCLLQRSHLNICGALTIFFLGSYGGEYLCWLDMDTSLYLGEYVPIGIMFIVTVVLIEAAGSADETSMPKLPDQSEAQLISAKVMHRSLILRYLQVAMLLYAISLALGEKVI